MLRIYVAYVGPWGSQEPLQTLTCHRVNLCQVAGRAGWASCIFNRRTSWDRHKREQESCSQDGLVLLKICPTSFPTTYCIYVETRMLCVCALRKDTRVKFSGSSTSSVSTPCNRSEAQKVLFSHHFSLVAEAVEQSLFFFQAASGSMLSKSSGRKSSDFAALLRSKACGASWMAGKKTATVGKVAPNKRDSDINHSYWVYTFSGVRKMLALICFVIPGNSTRILAPCPVGNHGLTCGRIACLKCPQTCLDWWSSKPILWKKLEMSYTHGSFWKCGEN